MEPQHLRPKAIWNFINLKADLSREEREHLVSCAPCQQVLRGCLLDMRTEDVEELDGDAIEKRRAA